MIGLLKELALLPVAPLRFTIWVAEQVADEADRQRYSPAALVEQLDEIDAARRAGTISEEQAAESEARIIEARVVGDPSTDQGEKGANDG